MTTMKWKRSEWIRVAVGIGGCLAFASAGYADPPVVPGSGHLINEVGDDFEDPHWNYNFNHPKSSRNIDEKERGPLGRSHNARWLEGPHRGTPDVMDRVPTPEGGLERSGHALLLRS
ncbi:MAG TPA: hypothetical protein VIY86_11440, partial [Pirellulaceae bacterium]